LLVSFFLCDHERKHETTHISKNKPETLKVKIEYILKVLSEREDIIKTAVSNPNNLLIINETTANNSNLFIKETIDTLFSF
jgi:hypothetical protein